MSNSMNKNLPLDPPMDPYEREIDQLWAEILQNFEDENAHDQLLVKAQKYLLLDRVAKFYKNYLIEHPGDEFALKYQTKLINLAAFTCLSNQRSETKKRKKYNKILLPLFLIVMLVIILVASLHYYKFKKSTIEYYYHEGLNSLVKADFDKAREYFNKVEGLQPDYRDVRTRLLHIDEIEEDLKSKNDSVENSPTPLSEEVTGIAAESPPMEEAFTTDGPELESMDTSAGSRGAVNDIEEKNEE